MKKEKKHKKTSSGQAPINRQKRKKLNRKKHTHKKNRVESQSEAYTDSQAYSGHTASKSRTPNTNINIYEKFTIYNVIELKTNPLLFSHLL